MAIRLVKIAKELNVGTSTIVDFLKGKGFEIDNKPTAKISEEMHSELLKEFSSSMAVKEQANQLIIGNRHNEEETTEVKKPIEEATVEKTVAKEEKQKEAEPIPEIKPESVVPEERKTPEKTEDEPKKLVEQENRIGLKVQGKIDLDSINKPKKKTTKPKDKPVTKKQKEAELKTDKEEVPKVMESKVVKEKQPVDPEIAPEDPNEEYRAKTPQLQGLKIQGKIDISKIEPEKKPKKDTDNKSEDGQRQKRKRKRKPVPVKDIGRKGGKPGSKGGKPGGARGGRRNEEVKEVTQKEIEEKIKATMARISGGGKNKRQKIRRDNREVKREKAEIAELENIEDNSKIRLTEFISVSEFASLMDVPVIDVITTCMNLGVIVSINQRLDAEIIELVSSEFNKEVEFISAEESGEEEEEIVDDPADLEPRAPIVTVMGHVDHGKTSLLDQIRNANVADGEAGGITQHIGAYEVKAGPDRKKVTFLDTPGHEAFTAMRARGAKVTDVAVIIIAADDKIMPQTKEAISHAQAAGVPIVFAINKIDKDGADPERIKSELATMNFLVEDWGGKYQSQDISAKNNVNIDKLLEKILLEAEILELKANPNRAAIGAVIEASLDKGRGYVTKLLVQTGTLKVGDPMVAGAHSGKVKAMFNERGKRVKEAGPSAPVLVLGLSGAPQAGEKFKIMDSEQEARQIATKRSQIEREQTTRASKRISLDEIGRRLALGSFKELNLIVKGDVDGSIEALSDSLIKLSVESIQVNIIHKAVGQIIESDILLASASDAIVIGFQVRPSLGARQLAEKEGVEIKTYSIIYEAIDEVKMAMEGLLEPTKEEKVIGTVEVRETYKISKVGTIAGSFVTDGQINRGSHIRVIRDGIVIYPSKPGVVGELASLKRFKDDAKEVKKGMECGLNIKGYDNIRVGDIIEAYEIVEIKQTL